MGTLPILALNCQRDPGSVNPGGGRAISPGDLEALYGCEPAKAVAVTVYNLDIDFHVRCDTDAEGRCDVEAPGDPERELLVAVHTASVDPGFAPIEPLGTTVHYTEFTGVGIVNLPVAEGTPASASERRTLTMNIETCEEGAERCAREPAGNVLAQVSAGGMTSRDAPWLATNDRGRVIFDLSALEGESIDMMFATEQRPRVDCTDTDATETLATEWVDGREGSFARITPLSTGDIRCDVTLDA